MAEAGFEDFVVTAYQGIAAPAGLPDDIAMRLNRELAALLAEPTVIEKLKKIGNIPRPSSPEDYKARLAADIALWKGVVDSAHLTRI